MSLKALDEALRILAEAEKQEVTLRLLGGTAILLRCPSAGHGALARARAPDVDLAGLKRQSMGIKGVFLGLGYDPNDHFNALHGYKQLMFYGPGREPKVDVFLDQFDMCHRLDLRPRLGLARATLPLEDLLFTKLQIVQVNEKDLKDIVALFLDHDVVEDGGTETIGGQYLAEMGAGDWGVYTTLTDNLGKAREFVEELRLGSEPVERVQMRIDRLKGMMDAAPKSVGWRMRAKLGRRMAWYDLPDEPTTITFGPGRNQ